MSLIKKILLAIAIVAITIQLFPPAHNKSAQEPATDISKSVIMPPNVEAVLKKACYDCHSNNTRYPWYTHLQPIGWMMASHIKDGKKELNFSEFSRYTSRRQVSKLNGIANSIKDDIMPLSSYKLMHKEAQLTAQEKELIINWALQTKDGISAKK